MHGICSDNLSRVLDFDAEQSRRAREKRVRGNSYSGSKHASQEFSPLGDHVEINGRSKIHDDTRAAILGKCRDAIGDAVCAYFLGIVDEDGHAGLDAGLDEQRLDVKIPLATFLRAWN